MKGIFRVSKRRGLGEQGFVIDSGRELPTLLHHIFRKKLVLITSV